MKPSKESRARTLSALGVPGIAKTLRKNAVAQAARDAATMESPEHERRSVVGYMQAQAPDETVEHAEKVASEHVFGARYDVWDVHTDKRRWWVVTNMTNLYSQQDFKSMNGVLTFHIGLMTRMMDAQSRKAPDRPDPRLMRTRRLWEQAAEAQNVAEEAEDFQTVGMRCRETLVSLAQDLASNDLVPASQDAPKASDFVHWAELIANAVAAGAPLARLRGLLKSSAKEAWEYVAWVTHNKSATRFDAEIAVQTVASVLALFEDAIDRHDRGGPERCPVCASYRLGSDFLFDSDAGTVVSVRLCERCDWSEEYEPEPMSAPLAESEPIIGDCLPSSEL